MKKKKEILLPTEVDLNIQAPLKNTFEERNLNIKK